uniref:Uncharacterized protein n=1 Tax=Parastrongyloides trichosuri TaxID=131310 RepID=A0A0N4ZR57_PARTI
MIVLEYLYLFFITICIILTPYGCSMGGKTKGKDKGFKTKGGSKQKSGFKRKETPNKTIKVVDSTVPSGEKKEEKKDDKKASRKSIKPPRFEASPQPVPEPELNVDKTQSDVVQAMAKKEELKTARLKAPTDKKIVSKSVKNNSKHCIKNGKKDAKKESTKKDDKKDDNKDADKDEGKDSPNAPIEKKSKDEKKGDEGEMSSPDLNKETKDETTNVKDKITDVTKEPSQAIIVVKKDKPKDEPKPKKIELDEKEKLIATGAIAKKKKTDYPTMDDVLSDWDTEKEKAAQTLGKPIPPEAKRRHDKKGNVKKEEENKEEENKENKENENKESENKIKSLELDQTL